MTDRKDRRLHLLSTLLELSVNLHRIRSRAALAKLASRSLQGEFGIMQIALLERGEKGKLRYLVKPSKNADPLRRVLKKRYAGKDQPLPDPFQTVVQSQGEHRDVIVVLGPSFTGAELGNEEISFVDSLGLLLAARMDQMDFIKAQHERLKLKQEMSIAKDIQQDLLPQPPSLKGWLLETSFEPNAEVGGDIYDFYQEGDWLYVSVGDVVGKGAGAAILMAHVQAATRAAWNAYPQSPAQAMSVISKALFASTAAHRYASLVLAMVNLKTGEVRYCNGGHPYPLWMHGEGNQWLRMGGVPVGLLEDAAYREQAFDLAPGDSLLLVTDGVFEERPEPLSGWRALYEECLQRGGMEDLKAALAERPWQPGHRDDTTLLWLRREV